MVNLDQMVDVPDSFIHDMDGTRICIGLIKSGRRCRADITESDTERAEELASEVPEVIDDPQALDPHLRAIAHYTLCYRWHRRDEWQIQRKVTEWTRLAKEWAEDLAEEEVRAAAAQQWQVVQSGVKDEWQSTSDDLVRPAICPAPSAAQQWQVVQSNLKDGRPSTSEDIVRQAICPAPYVQSPSPARSPSTTSDYGHELSDSEAEQILSRFEKMHLQQQDVGRSKAAVHIPRHMIPESESISSDSGGWYTSAAPSQRPSHDSSSLTSFSRSIASEVQQSEQKARQGNGTKSIKQESYTTKDERRHEPANAKPVECAQSVNYKSFNHSVRYESASPREHTRTQHSTSQGLSHHPSSSQIAPPVNLEDIKSYFRPNRSALPNDIRLDSSTSRPSPVSTRHKSRV